MIVRRVLFGACTVLFVTAAPASADHNYSHVDVRTPGGVSAISVGASGKSDGGLPQTGSNYLVPMAEGATVLIGAGALLVLATRRRRSTSTASA